MHKKFTFLWGIISLLFSFSAIAQEARVYWIEFTDKNNSPYSLSAPEAFLSARSIQRREKQNIAITEEDFPVNPDYLTQIGEAGARVRHSSRWFNAALVEATPVVAESIFNLPFVKGGDAIGQALVDDAPVFPTPTPGGLEHDGREETLSDEGSAFFSKSSFLAESPRPARFLQLEEDYGQSRTQVEILDIHKMHEDGHHGEGMIIAVMDGGFRDVNLMGGLAHMDIGMTYDFIFDSENVYNGVDHGTRVLSTMAAYKPGEIIGGAYSATYLLFKTEDSRQEMPVEEAYWVLAAEKADSVGADVINTSLGYYDFDDPSFNYTPEDLDGQTALITRGTNLAASKGMILITSAGNAGNNAWGALTFPADAPGGLSVGSVNSNLEHASSSSQGPTADGRIKPDLAALGAGATVLNTANLVTTSNGTSFAAPQVAALAAGCWQAFPEKSSAEIMDILRWTASQAQNPEPTMGYGIPHYGGVKRYIITALEEELPQETSPVKLRQIPVPEGEPLQVLFPERLQGQEVQISLCDALGRTLRQTSTTATQTLFLSFPAQFGRSGFLRIEHKNGTEVLRVLRF